MANVNIRVDDTLKREAEEIFTELGLSMSAATTVFYKQVVRYGGIPFELRVSDLFYSAENQAWLRKSINDYETGKSKPIIKTMAELEEMANE
ncbi:MAG: type II toxin-antitoxin system RelB/DinJ family antitoxin [Oscillospiraceae bacterium]|jgi:DNA-damage-inducible protein J|nr:type II toxin-antitoxin system RelB/DinJ family antitoxin [Oscillospiraceae bacterium]